MIYAIGVMLGASDIIVSGSNSAGLSCRRAGVALLVGFRARGWLFCARNRTGGRLRVCNCGPVTTFPRARRSLSTSASSQWSSQYRPGSTKSSDEAGNILKPGASPRSYLRAGAFAASASYLLGESK